jgi:hypothetical protein
MRLPICLHLAVLFAAQAAAFLAGGGLAMLLWTGPWDASVPMRSAGYAIYLAVPSLLGWLAAGAVVRGRIRARCPLCGGPSRCRGSDPVSYTCEACGHVSTSGARKGRKERGR